MTGIFRRRGGEATSPPQVTGPARVDHRTKRLVTRLRPGEIAVIDHEDLDRVAAESLVAAQPAAVLNVARSTTGRYPRIARPIAVPTIPDSASGVSITR